MMPSIFISYRQSDNAGYAGRIFDRLRYWFGKDELFFDIDTIEMGDDFPEEIDRAIRAVAAVLVIIGPQWLDLLNREYRNLKWISFAGRWLLRSKGESRTSRWFCLYSWMVQMYRFR